MQFQNVIAIVGIRIHAKKNINILYCSGWIGTNNFKYSPLDRSTMLQIQDITTAAGIMLK